MKKKMNNKGFTLVELIVVLVILAILAAILVPALLGYIDRAKKQQIVLNAKSYLTATQAEFSAMYGANSTSVDGRETKIQETADIPACTAFEVKTTGDFNLNDHSTYTIYAAKYTEGTQVIYFADGSWDATSDQYDAAKGKSKTGAEVSCGDAIEIKK